MTEIDSHFDETLPASAASSGVQAILRKKIGWLCQIIRGMAVVWALWILYFVVTFWGNREKAAGAYSKLAHFDPATLPDLNYYAAFGIMLLDWCLVAAVAFTLWRLFSLYLSGVIFSVEAALGLRRLALVGGFTLAFDIVKRPVIFQLMTAGHDTGDRHGWFFQPADLLDAIFVTFLFSLAYIFKTAAELADEHAQIV
jgi:hypothetical protein